MYCPAYKKTSRTSRLSQLVTQTSTLTSIVENSTQTNLHSALILPTLYLFFRPSHERAEPQHFRPLRRRRRSSQQQCRRWVSAELHPYPYPATERPEDPDYFAGLAQGV